MQLNQAPFSQACENNKHAILEVLKRYLGDASHVLEIGSGTGQHAAFFAEHLPHLSWQTTDLPENHPGINAWIDDFYFRNPGLENLYRPITLDVNNWPTFSDHRFDALFSANTLHIMSWPEVEHLFQGIGAILNPSGLLILYGPFNYQGQYTSLSNAEFDQRLKQSAPHRGIRDYESIERLSAAQELMPFNDHSMPANNRCLVFRKN